ncbi:hypothetical protein H3146_27655 [Streptomyces sp. OF3]|uniref:Uncharacterized protein n=1 Tax=Streptomyces alkaliterrae TaxID=2213162 RepID=A0A7W3WRB7_9ACTN|nr:hypothetical protein [Streptomyces alkaliterrae]MBB1257074.1 hypothetical protein [Streptomyces alkaliterrae]
MSDPITVVRRQLDAYNAHDLDAFVATYSGWHGTLARFLSLSAVRCHRGSSFAWPKSSAHATGSLAHRTTDSVAGTVVMSEHSGNSGSEGPSRHHSVRASA